MMKLFARFSFIFMLCVATGKAQSTTVSGTIADPLGNSWGFGTVTAVFQRAPGSSFNPIWTGGTLNPTPPTVAMDAAGNVSFSLPSNTAITPSGSTWLVSVCPNSSQACAVINVSVSGTTYNLENAINSASAWPTSLVPPTTIAKVYNTNQTYSPPLNQGGMLYNTATQSMLVYTSTGWQPFATVGSGVPVLTNPPGNQTITQPLNSVFNFIVSGTGSVNINGNQIHYNNFPNNATFNSSISGGNTGGASKLNNFSIGQLGTNPSAFGLPSNGVSTSTTGSITIGTSSLIVGSTSFINKNNGIFVNHAGVACGVTRGTPCPSGIAPTITQGGTPGTTTYNYKVSCIDGLGGYSAAPTTYTTTTGNATLSGSNPNLLSFTGVAGCIEVAVYRSTTLIGEVYVIPGSTSIFTDSGQTVASHRDIPLAPPATAGNDNLVAFVTAVSGTTLTLSSNAGATVSGAFTMLSDTPLVQAALNTLPSVGNVFGDSAYRINYPVFTPVGAGGTITLYFFCDTGDVCMDITGQQGLQLNNVNLTAYGTLTAPSTVGLYCARDTGFGGTSQHLYSINNFYTMGTPTMAGGGNGVFPNTVPFYNYACEIGDYVNLQTNGNQGIVFTATNIAHIQSLFDATQSTGPQSMSDVHLVEPNLSTTNGAMIEADGLFTLHVTGGYGFGGDSTSHPYLIEAFGGGLSNSFIHDFRTEAVSGFVHVEPNAGFTENDIFDNLFHDTNSITPLVQLDAGALFRQNHVQINSLTNGVTQPFFSCFDTTCSVFSNPYISITSGTSWNAASAQQSDNWVCIWNSTCSYSGTLQGNTVTTTSWATTSNCMVNACGSAASGIIVFPVGTATETITTSVATTSSRPSLSYLYTAGAPTNLGSLGAPATTALNSGSFVITLPTAPTGNAIAVTWNLFN